MKQIPNAATIRNITDNQRSCNYLSPISAKYVDKTILEHTQTRQNSAIIQGALGMSLIVENAD